MFGKKFQAKTEKRLSELQHDLDNLGAIELKPTIEEAQRLAGRKTVRRRNPQTGRFESVYADEPAT